MRNSLKKIKMCVRKDKEREVAKRFKGIVTKEQTVVERKDENEL